MRSRLEIIEANRRAEEKEKRNEAEDRREFDSVCENCEQPAEYHTEVILCEACSLEEKRSKLHPIDVEDSWNIARNQTKLYSGLINKQPGEK